MFQRIRERQKRDREREKQDKARQKRRLKIARQRDDQHKKEIEWLESYKEYERTGIAILQRGIRLQEGRKFLFGSPANKGLAGDTPPYGFTELLKDLDKQIGLFRGQYWAGQQELGIIWSRKALGTRTEDWEIDRKQIVRQDKSFGWAKQSRICAFSDGCCARGCGCCERPLRTYPKPMGAGGEQKEEVIIYGHCTAECLCCIRYRGAYTSDPSIKTGDDHCSTEDLPQYGDAEISN
jgi:hypothetical protein